VVGTRQRHRPGGAGGHFGRGGDGGQRLRPERPDRPRNARQRDGGAGGHFGRDDDGGHRLGDVDCRCRVDYYPCALHSFSTRGTRPLSLGDYRGKLTEPSVVVRLMVLVKLCTTAVVVTAHFSITLVQSWPPSGAALHILARTWVGTPVATSCQGAM